MDEEKYTKNAIRNYIIIVALLIALSFLGFIFNEWILPICVGICSIFGFLEYYLLLKSRFEVSSDGTKGRFTIFMIFRYLCMILGIVASCLLVKFTMGEEVNKLRYIIVIVAAIPYVVTTLALLLTKQE